MKYPKNEQAALEDCRERLAKSYEAICSPDGAKACRNGRYDDDCTITSMMQLRRDFSTAIMAGGEALEAFIIPEQLTVDERITELAKELLVEQHPDYRESIMAGDWLNHVKAKEKDIRAGMELAEKLAKGEE